jgi:acetyl-CoA carboxylase carboxyltransferase component
MTNAELESRRQRALDLGGESLVAKEHDRGRLTVRERIDRLVDPGSFREVGTLTTLPIVDIYGNVTEVRPTPYVGGLATVGGRNIVVGGEDFTVNYGAPSQHLEKFKGGFSGYIEELAFEYRLPLILLLHGAGGDVGFADAVGFTAVPSAHDVFPMAELLEVVPVVTAVLGVVGGGAGVRAVASHFSVMSRPQGMMFAAGPAIVQRALGAPIDKYELGGVDVHVIASGNVDNIVESEEQAFAQIRTFLSYVPTNVDHLPSVLAPVPAKSSTSEVALTSVGSLYDPVDLIESIVDAGSWFPIGDDFGASLRTGLCRVEGQAVGLLAHDPRVLDGMLDGLAADKHARFVQFCDVFHIPIVVLVNTAGVLADLDSESGSVLRRVVRAIEAMHRARVPMLAVHVGHCDGLGGMTTSSPNRTALRVGWPTASFGNSGDMDTTGAMSETPWQTAEYFGIEEIIDPTETRTFVASWLQFSGEVGRPGSTAGSQYRP